METVNNPTADFTSSVLPSKPGLKASCSIPLGFIITPLAKTDYIQSLSSQEMNICVTCGSYLNMYCSPDSDSGMWTCCICQAKNKAPQSILNSEVLYSPIVEYRQRAAGSFVTDTETMNAYSNDERISDPVMILIDANISPHEVKAILKYLSALELQNVGLMIFSSMMHVYQIGLKGIASADVYSPSLSPQESGIEPEERMYFGDWSAVEYCTNVYFGTSGVETNVSPQNDSYTLEPISSSRNQQPMSRKEMLRLKREARLKKEKVANSEDFDGFDPNKAAEWITAARSKRRHKSQRESVRCTAEAAQHAAHFMTSMDCKSGRVLIFTNGCCNIGNGSVVRANNGDHAKNGSMRRGDVLDPEYVQEATKFFYSVGEEAFQSGIGFDIFCGGNGTLGASALLGLVKPSGGYVLSHGSFEASEFNRNVSFVCEQTKMSRSVSNNADPDAFILSMASPHRMNYLNGVVVDVRMPSFITPTLCHGSGTINKEAQSPCPNERAVFVDCSYRQGLQSSHAISNKIVKSTLTQIQMGRYDPTSSISILMDVTKAIPDHFSYGHFQFVTRYIDPLDIRTLVTRVATQRVAMSKDTSIFLQSLNDEAVPVTLAKEAAFRSMILRNNDDDDRSVVVSESDVDVCGFLARRDLDSTVYAISKAYRFHMKSQEGDETFTDTAVPPELCQSFKKMHHFRRGPILREGRQSADDRAISRDILLRSSLLNSSQMIAPSVWRCCANWDGKINFVLAPAETLVLWDESVLAVDAFDDLFVWSGKAVLSERFDPLRKACISFLLDRSRFRFPSPKLHGLIEGDPMCRKLTTRLVPSHGDPHDHQLTHYPDLSTLDAQSIGSLRAKFRMYDAKCDSSFRGWFWKVVKDDEGGDSLCS